ncbi:M56 family metallopeptidase [Pseudoalteromonas sp. H105]|jgi:beta-lactamase regulating signal transducer with metallopeptidase domain|uniref:M56 family metallopeptidase n=1 Tax=Pseudoalteromonas sp. H105 TaxID=1348393 RepID=UPI000731FEAB|nr:M56 family metallopeptidase [Pseudoalteromonas sp. H105]KTF15634.1 peptidase M56, BlaR1 [Pseudoalteromonas sp. H105]
MMIEYTLLTTLAFHHLVIGFILLIGLSLLNRCITLSAELKSWLWMTAFVAATVLPFSLITQEGENTVVSVNTSAPVNALKSTPDALTPLTSHTPNKPVNSWHLPSEIVFNFTFLLSLGVFVWFMGSVWRTFTVLSSYIQTRFLIRSTIEQALDLSTHIDAHVYTSDKVSSPLVVGLKEPKIIIPKSLTEQLKHEQLRAIVLHEYAHIKRGDNWFGLFQEVIAILFWWSPVIRILNKQIHVEREIACDLRAVNELKSTQLYAQSLIDCAKLMVTQQRSVLAMGLFSKKKELNYRVGAVLENKQFKKPRITVITLICAAVTATTIQATQTFSPKISIKHTTEDARHYSLLPKFESQALIEAVSRNDIEAVQALQGEGVDINIPLIGDGTALMIAVKQNNKVMAQALIDLGADVNQSSSGDGNPLIVAAMSNNTDLARLLLDNGADVNAIVPRDETPLINASYFGFYAMTELLIERGADVNLAVTTGASDGYQLRSPLNRARTDRIKSLLIANGAR